MNELLVQWPCFKAFFRICLLFHAKLILGNLQLNPLIIWISYKLKKLRIIQNIEMDFNHLGTEEESNSDDKTPLELEKLILELHDKPKPN